MRLLAAAVLFLGLTACFQAPGEPLTPTSKPTPPTTAARPDRAISALATSVRVASEQAYAAADAGRLHDRLAAENAAVALGDAAALVVQRAQEAGDSAAVNDAVRLSTLAAEIGGAIADDLDPPATQVCGCEGCQEVPGTVDEAVLSADVNAAIDAGVGCADASASLTG